MTGPRSRSRLPVALVLALVAAAAGCSEENGPDQTLSLAEARLIARDYAAGAVLGADLYTMTLLGVFAGEGGKGGDAPSRLPAPGDTLLPGVLTCPVVTAGVVAGSSIQLTFDYGTGCAATFDGAWASGAVEVTAVERPAGGFELTGDFDGFTREGRTLDGALFAEGRLDSVAITLSGLAWTGPEGSVIADGGLELKRIGALPTDGGLCVTWSVENGLVTLDTAKANYEIEIITPVRLSTCCAYPVSGAVQVTAGGFVPARIDFGDGTCDTAAEVTIAGVTETISLGAPLDE